MTHKFKPGDLVSHKGFTGYGKGGRFIVIEQLEDIGVLTKSKRIMYKLKFLETPGPLEKWEKWNNAAKDGEYAKEYEDYLVFDVAYHRQKQLKKLGI